VTEFPRALTEAPIADVNVIGFPDTPNVDDFIECVRMARGTCIFVRDSGRENALV
jgi:solute carrier family 12 (sodium/potassium/chloride transporter), member 2